MVLTRLIGEHVEEIEIDHDLEGDGEEGLEHLLVALLHAGVAQVHAYRRAEEEQGPENEQLAEEQTPQLVDVRVNRDLGFQSPTV